MTRYYGDPGLSIEVKTDRRGFPALFFAREHRERVAVVVNSWRVDSGWWRPIPIHRTYFRLLTESEVFCDIYWDDVTQSWHLEREYD